ncbi:hypothetical protein GFV12_01100 [Desulfurobacterium thermolithotrophum]|uniref:hypothetical protein n=1 Tax=Desulfurobacterium thermolithotrophum TaxID=64160 RepID=UPI0013D8DCDE|nr:hypothetical protein [Desulfurobacterium thermolithotrophum]
MKKLMLLATLSLIFSFSSCSCKWQTKMEKEVLKVTGGEFTVKVYDGGKLITTYKGKGYVWFEMDKNGRHTGVVTFRDERGHIIRVGGFGGVVIVDYQ